MLKICCTTYFLKQNRVNHRYNIRREVVRDRDSGLSYLNKSRLRSAGGAIDACGFERQFAVLMPKNPRRPGYMMARVDAMP